MTFGWTPASSARVAWVCLRSCSLIFGSPASRTWWSKNREKVRGQIGVPFSRQKTRSCSSYAGPQASRSSSWRSRCSRRASTVLGVEGHAAPPALGLRLGELWRAPALDQGAGDRQPTGVEVDRVPTQAEQLAAADAGHREDAPRRKESVCPHMARGSRRAGAPTRYAVAAPRVTRARVASRGRRGCAGSSASPQRPRGRVLGPYGCRGRFSAPDALPGRHRAGSASPA